MILKFLEEGLSVEKILEEGEIAVKFKEEKSEQKKLAKLIKDNLHVTNRLAIVRMERFRNQIKWILCYSYSW